MMENTSTSLSTRKRPLGVLLIGLAGILLNCFRIAAIILNYHKMPSFNFIHALAWSLFILVCFVSLIKLQDWARVLLLIIAGLSCFSNAAKIIMLLVSKTAEVAFSARLVVSLVHLGFIGLACFLFYYLTLARIKEQTRGSLDLSGKY